ncbi:MAG: MMPL family transporter [Planctomycetes bacterium]|nr:MMPL family transporter [Planctomycetota bacterium]
MRDRLLEFLARAAVDRPRSILAIALITAILGAGLAALRLRVNANTDDLISPDRPYMQDYRAFLAEFGDLEGLYVVVVDRGQAQETAALVDELAERLRAQPELSEIHHRIEPVEQRRLAPRAVTEDELRDLTLISGAFPVWQAPGGAAAVLTDARQKLRRLAIGGGSEDQQEALGAQALSSLELLAIPAFEPSAIAQGIDDLLAPLAPQYLKTETGRLWFIEILPPKDYGTLSVIEAPLTAVRRVVAAFLQDHPGVEAGLTGKPVLQADEMRTTDRDMTRSSLVAVLLVGILFMVVLGGVRGPGAAIFCLLVAIAWTFGVTTLVVGQLNLLSIVFTLVLVGIGIDFGVHVVTRFQEEREHHGLQDAIMVAMRTSGRGNVSAAITSSIAFFMTLFTDFQGLRELGLIGGLGILLCLVAMVAVLPAALVVVEARVDDRRARRLGLGAIGRARRPGRRLLVAGVLTVCLLPFAWRVGFDGNVLELQAEGLDSVRWEHRILDDSASASWFAASIANDETELAERLQRVRGEAAIGAARSIFDLVQPMTPRRRGLLETLADPAELIGLPDDETLTSAELLAGAEQLRDLAQRARERAPDDFPMMMSLAKRLRDRAVALDSEAANDHRHAIEARVARAAEVATAFTQGARMALDQGSLRTLMPAALRARLVAPSGRLLLALHPAQDVWDEDAMSRFVASIRRVDEHATGAPITHHQSIQDMGGGFQRAALLALLGVLIVVALDFHNLRDIVFAILPLTISFIWLIVAMGLFGIDFNLANFFAVPILIGLGVDGGIHIVHRHHEGHDLGSTRRGIFLTNATSMIGFGCLLFASHRGLQSLGAVMTLGCATCLIATLGILPPLLSLFGRDRPSA